MTRPRRPTMEYQITEYLPTCKADIILVWEQSVRATHYFLAEADILHFKELVEQMDFSVFTMFCAFASDGSLAGFAGVSNAKLDMLFLHPAHMGKGLGKLLLRKCIEEYGVCELEVNEQNQQALAFYRHFGFEVVSRKPTDDFDKPYPILCMQLKTGSSLHQYTPTVNEQASLRQR